MTMDAKVWASSEKKARKVCKMLKFSRLSFILKNGFLSSPVQTLRNPKGFSDLEIGFAAAGA
jgi:hypothetical protein